MFDIDVSRLAESIPVMGMGMLGIFLVTGVIILSVTLLNKITNKKYK